ncbi:valacyclovir hydrolase isoform X1 [Ochlerotatus camptorhynchus]|uniref:valacyclovir hydrolase isoform X1 n=2 Tax=Ochlerotatus camptorhynchus TaxID=644619 RepID=UPI0031DE8A0E
MRLLFRGLKPVVGCAQLSICRSLNTRPSPMEKQLQIAGHKINFVEAGSGDKGVILLPGALGTAWTDFKPQIEHLPTLLPNHKIIAWDPPGYGKSRPPDKDFGVDFYEKDAEAAASLMEKIGFRSFSVVGWSDGGITGLIMAGRKPSLVDKLVIWGSNAYITPKEAGMFENIRDVSKWSARMREPMEKVYGTEGFPKIWSAWVDGMINMYKQRNGDICREVLDKIRAPTFILHGAKDPMIVPEHVPYLQNSIADTDLHVFVDGKHNIHLKYAEEFNKLVSDFIKK